jgi:hypothetical protein
MCEYLAFAYGNSLDCQVDSRQQGEFEEYENFTVLFTF